VHVDPVFGAIGGFSVRFRWFVTLAWIAFAVAAVALLPALSSVTQSNNTKFLPASAPVEQAVRLAAPFGTANLLALPVVAARTGAPLTPADAAALTALQQGLASAPSVQRTVDIGRSADGQAEQLLVLAIQGGGNPNHNLDLVNALRAKIARAGLPAGVKVHLAGDVAVAVDQQKATGNTGNKVQDLSALFIVVLLVLIFRSLTLALTTILPAIFAVAISGPLVAEAARHGLQVSPLAQYLMVVLVLGAGTDYGLFLVFRAREELRAGDELRPGGSPRAGDDGRGWLHPGASGMAGSLLRDLAGSRQPATEALVRAVTRVGESITFSAATVVAAVLTLLVASFPFYSNLGLPFAIAIGVTLLAALTLLPALLSIRLSLIAVKRTVFSALFGRPKLVPFDIQGTGKTGVWGRVAGSIVRRPALTLVLGVIIFGALAVGSAGYAASGFGGSSTPPAASDSAAGNTLLARHFPQSSANPTTLIFRFSQPVWTNPAVLATATSRLQAEPVFTQVVGPLNPVGPVLPAADYTRLHALLGPAKRLPPTPPPGSKVPLGVYQLYRATGNYVSPDGRTVQFSAGLRADPGSTAALDAVPAIRAAVSRVGAAVSATASGVGGLAPALYDISAISNSDLSRVIPIAILAIGLLLALVLRSLVAPLYLIASVALSYLAALGLSVLLFIKIGGQGGLVFYLPFLMFVFLLALGEDYNILVMTRIREEAHKLPLRDAVARAISVTGTTVTSAGLVLAGTFVVFGLVAGGGAGGTQFQDIAFGLALGIVMDTFLVRTLLVPSTVVLLGRWNWWPSKISMDRPDDSQPAAAAGTSAPSPELR